MGSQGLFPATIKNIDAKAIFFQVHDLEEFGLEVLQLSQGDPALKEGELDPLTVVFTDLSHPAQSPLAVL
jgi:hypothetical protein